MLIIIATLLCSSALSVNSDCAQADQRFATDQIALTRASDSGGEKICTGGDRCCASLDLPKFTGLAQSKMSEFLRDAFQAHLAVLRRSVNQLDASVCWKIHATSNATNILLSQTYFAYYVRNKNLFLDFFCNLTNIYKNCDMCYSSVDTLARGFLRRLLMVLLKESSSVRYVSAGYEQCVADNTRLEDTFGSSTFTWFVARLQKSLCRTCFVSKALEQAADLLHHAKKPHMNTECERKVRCMQSCSCCRGSAECGLRPCHSCCMKSLDSCLEADFSPLSPSLVKTIDHLLFEAQQMMDSAHDPDYLLNALSVTISEAIMNAYGKISEITKHVTATCGAIVSYRVLSQAAPPPVSCSVCQSSQSRSVHIALSNIYEQLPPVRHAFSALSERICSVHAVRKGTSDSCDSCSQCSNGTAPAKSPSAYLDHLRSFERNLPASFKEALKATPSPLRSTRGPRPPYPHPDSEDNGSAPDCSNPDDEDCDGSGSGSGSGTPDWKNQIKRTNAPYWPSPHPPVQMTPRPIPPVKTNPSRTQRPVGRTQRPHTPPQSSVNPTFTPGDGATKTEGSSASTAVLSAAVLLVSTSLFFF